LEGALQGHLPLQSLSPIEVINQNGGLVATTGSLFIQDSRTLAENIRPLLSTAETSVGQPVIRDWQIFLIKPKNEGGNGYTAEYFGEYVVARPTKPQLSDKHERGMHWENEDKKVMQELKSSSSAKGFLKAGLKFGKNKFGRFMDEQKHGGSL